jgi:hypothetical protein
VARQRLAVLRRQHAARLLTIGGTRFGEDWTTPPEPGHAPPTTLIGLSYATRYDGTTWRRIADPLKGRGGTGETWRWYGQGTRLADGRVLVLGGFDYVSRIVDGEFTGTPSANSTAELFDPTTETFTLLGSGAAPPEIINGDYSHPFVLPYVGVGADVIEFGWTSEPVYLNVAAAGWHVEREPRPGAAVGGGQVLTHPNDGASSAMLPIRIANGEWGYFNGAIAIAGGEHGMPMEHHVDVWDVVANMWTRHVDIETRRHHPSTVLLPDGRLLILGGHDDTTPGNPEVGRALYLDPRNNFMLTGGYAMMGEVRGYHTVTLLLPDGRVLVGGGRSAGPLAGSDEKPTMRYYYPSYLFRARPIIDAAPATLGFGAVAQITARGNPTEAVLMALGSMTHSFDANQRYVQIGLAPRAGEPDRFDIVGPPNPQTAPPGYYMLFVLDAVRTPSVAAIVRVQ